MQRVLVISKRIQQGHHSRFSFKFDETVHVSEIDAGQINPRRLVKSFGILHRTDLIILQDSISPSERTSFKRLISFLEATGIPIVVLPETTQKDQTSIEPRILNWPGHNRSHPEMASLLAQICSQYAVGESTVVSSQKNTKSSPVAAAQGSTSDDFGETVPSRTTQPFNQQVGVLASYGKIASTFTAVRRVSGQLREPLSNMNLAIHMLSQARSPTDQERYIRLLREEYNRELQLLNQLDSYLQADLPVFPPQEKGHL